MYYFRHLSLIFFFYVSCCTAWRWSATSLCRRRQRCSATMSWWAYFELTIKQGTYSILFYCTFLKAWLKLNFFLSLLVLWDVLRAECGDAQADGDRQEVERHHSPAPSLPLTRGMKLTRTNALQGLLAQQYCTYIYTFFFSLKAGWKMALQYRA